MNWQKQYIAREIIMKKTTATLVAGFIGFACFTVSISVPHTNAKASEYDQQKLAGEARTIIKGFFKHLKGTLVGAMKEGGPVNALNVCKTKAGPITQEAAKKSGWNVARTSLKLRNPSNKADGWERSVLKAFETKKTAGADPKKMEYFEIINIDGKKSFRYMKAIPTGKPCLHCHGSQLKEPGNAKLGELYPTDKATGFKLGDIRGAFTLLKDLK
jgi:hypothetical protein